MLNSGKQISDLKIKLEELKVLLAIDKKSKRVVELRKLMLAPSFWEDQEKAVSISREAEDLQNELNAWEKIEADILEAEGMSNLIEAEGELAEGSLEEEMQEKYKELEKSIEKLEFKTILSGKYDNNNVLLSVYAGVGGIDAQDWAQMLMRMYIRFSERNGFKVQVLDRNYGNEAGLKSVTLEISGAYAYGYLKSENGVHRLLRNSPFNADGLRQTSFALVEVIPELGSVGDIVLKDEDIRIDVFRSSGPGGQSVNTTDSAVRIVHLESGLTVSCQSERSQHQNKESALKILKAKLKQAEIKKSAEKIDSLKGDVRQADWGRQIRSYFLYGNRLVKDHRSNLENTDVDAVLDGDITSFIEAYLKFSKL